QSGGRRSFEAAAGEPPGRFAAGATPPAQRRAGSGAELTGRFAAEPGPAAAQGRGGHGSAGPRGAGSQPAAAHNAGSHPTGTQGTGPQAGRGGPGGGPQTGGIPAPQSGDPHGRTPGPQGDPHGRGPQSGDPHGRGPGPQGLQRGGPQQRGPQGPGGRPSPYGVARQPGEAPPKPFVDLARFDPNPATTYRGTATTPGAFDWESTTQVAPFGLLQLAQAKRVRQLRLATIIFVVLAVVSAPAAFFVIREFTRDPVFVELDNLNLPEWAARNPTDGALGSRWCIKECRSRQRTWESARGPEETNRAFVGKLKDAGWVEWDIPDCQAEGVDGIETCWQRDEYVLDLWVRAAVCDVKNARPTVNPSQPGKPTAKAPASQSPSADPGPQPSEIESPGPAPTAICPLAVATIKVFNRISYGPGGEQSGG
ncbi:hypothetical protein, partial [Dactylosporangium sp. NPDC005555]|uniref:hypothetical protein n=1 Tax=Dactylosporangium sp. NPDC005555 TaxID=3154889 RepID=UPI0033A5FCF6